MKFEADYRHTQQTHSFSFLTQRTYSCNIFIGNENDEMYQLDEAIMIYSYK